MTAGDVVLPLRAAGARYLAADRKWLGLEPHPSENAAPARHRRPRKAASSELDPSAAVEMIALSVKENVVRCRLLNSDHVLTLRTNRTREVVPGEIVLVKPRKQWTYAGHPYLSGEVESTRLDVGARRLVPLRLDERGLWDPAKHYLG